MKNTKKKLYGVIKAITVICLIVGVLCIVFNLLFSGGFFGYILGGAFIFAAIIAYKTGIGYIDYIYRNRK